MLSIPFFHVILFLDCLADKGNEHPHKRMEEDGIIKNITTCFILVFFFVVVVWL